MSKKGRVTYIICARVHDEERVRLVTVLKPGTDFAEARAELSALQAPRWDVYELQAWVEGSLDQTWKQTQ